MPPAYPPAASTSSRASHPDLLTVQVRTHADIQQRRLQELSVEQLQALYSLLDDDGDGALTTHEVRKAHDFRSHRECPTLPPQY